MQKTVVKPTTPSAARVGVTSVAYNTTGKLLAAGMADGAIQVKAAEHNAHKKKPGAPGLFACGVQEGDTWATAQAAEAVMWTYVTKGSKH